MKNKGNNLRNLWQDDCFLFPALSALLLGLSRYPVKLNFLVFFGFIPLLYLMEKYSYFNVNKIVKTALSFSVTYILVALHWIAAVTIPGMIGIIILYSFYFLILFWIIFKIRSVYPKLRFIGLITAWISFEWLLNYGGLRFPWVNAGYSLAEYTALIQIAEYGGVYLLSVMVIVVNILFYSSFKAFPTRKSLISLIAVIVVLILWHGFGIYRFKTLPVKKTDVSASIVQVSIPQDIKWSEDYYNETLDLYEEYTMLAAESEPDLIIWPESAIPEYVMHSEKAHSYVSDVVRKAGSDIFLGFPHYDFDESGEVFFYNAAAVVHPNGEAGRLYYKNILVPVGERIPYMEYFSILRRLDFGQANWEYGQNIALYKLDNENSGYTYSPIICFEVAFPDQTRKIAEHSVDFIINITNDAWFKKTIGPYQHGMMTVIRAVETRTQFFRAANTGISMIVDPRGRILNKSGLFERTVIENNLYVYGGMTFYVQKTKNYPLIFLLVTGGLIITAIMGMFSLKKEYR